MSCVYIRQGGDDLVKNNQRAAERLIGLTVQHTKTLLKHAADPSDTTPLFANAIDPQTLLPVKVDPDHVNRNALLSSTASQQHWLKLLAGLSELTESPAYEERALAVLRFMLTQQTDESGLLYWGGHTAYNLESRSIEYAADKSKVHELKMHYPDYGIMWKADPQGTRRYIEAMWNAHILDWSRLDFNRHGPYGTAPGRIWQQEYHAGDVFFWGKGLTFVNAGSDLYYAAAMLSKLSGDKAPLAWSKRLARRYVETRQADIGISGYQFSQSQDSWCDGPVIRGDRAQYQIAPLIPEGHLVYEGTLFKPRPAVQRCQLEIGEQLGEEGECFIRYSCEEMTAWGKAAYRREDNAFVPMLTDGYRIEGLMLDRKGYFGPKGSVFKAIPAGSDYFWMYAAGYRLSGDPFLWEMARSIAYGMGLGEIGQPQSSKRVWNLNGVNCDYRLIYGLLELYRGTQDEQFLAFALQTSEVLLAASANGSFLTQGRILTDNPLPLALLHLAEVLLERRPAIPKSWK